VSAAELNYIQSDLTSHGTGTGTGTGTGRPAGWFDIAADRHVLMLTLSYFCYGYVAYIFFTWFFKYLSDVRGLNLKSSALYATLPFIAMALASWGGGLTSDKLVGLSGKRFARCGVAASSMSTAGIFVFAATRVADARVAAVVLAGGAGALYFAQSAFWAMSADIGGSSAGLLSGIMNMGCQIGGVVTAALTPVLANSFGWTASFAVTAVVAMLGATAWLFVDPFHHVAVRTR
jgi:ACS family glucarate transporter-like MFS transporter